MFSLLSMLWPNTDTFFIPTIKSYINNGNVIFSIQTKGYCALWLQIVKFIAWWYTVMSFNIRFVAPWKYTAHFLCEIFIFQQQSLVILIKTIKIPVQYNHYPYNAPDLCHLSGILFYQKELNCSKLHVEVSDT